MSYLIIGAGPVGLAMAKACKDAGIAYEQVEADYDLGGNWLHGVYSSVFMDTCKALMQYPEFPMPDAYPDFISGEQMRQYVNSYAEHFQLREKISFNTKVVWVSAADNNAWRVTFNNQTTKTYSGVVVCNGHHWDMRFAKLPGTFAGDFLHSKQYKGPAQIAGKRVLVIGPGNSGVDIACEAARVGSSAVLSMKDSPWIFPKTFMGVPLGKIKLGSLPRFLQPLLVKVLIKFSFGKHAYYKMPQPQHKPFDKHPTTSEELPYYLKHGRVTVKPGIKKTEGNTVWFDDDSHMEFDTIVSATGFNLSFPFLPHELVRTEGHNLKCIGHCAYPDYKGLFFIGWQQARGGVGLLCTAFSKATVDLIKLEEHTGMPAGKLLENMGNTISTTHLYGNNEIMKWIAKHTYEKLMRKARKGNHSNIPTPAFSNAMALDMQVY